MLMMKMKTTATLLPIQVAFSPPERILPFLPPYHLHPLDDARPQAGPRPPDPKPYQTSLTQVEAPSTTTSLLSSPCYQRLCSGHAVMLSPPRPQLS
jgi:hypothetical protein